MIASRVGLIILLLFFSAFFSGSETALFSLNPIKLRKMERRHKDVRTISSLLKEPSRLLITILIGNTLANVILSVVATSLFLELFGSKGLVLAIPVVTFLLLVFGEVTPKTFAVEKGEIFSLVAAGPLKYFSRLVFPLRNVLHLIANSVIRLVKTSNKNESTLTEEELKTIIDVGHREGVVKKEEREMIRSVLEFTDTEAKDIMTPRVDIKSASLDMGQEEFLEFACKIKHSKIPIYENSIDKIVGVVHAKEVFLNLERNFVESIRPVIFIPGTKKIDDLLKTLDQQKTKIAIIVDEHGGTDGLLTLEDILEEIFGEIYDEFETPEHLIERIDDKRSRVNGKLAVSEINEKLNLNIPEGEYETFAGFVLELLDKIPAEGERVRYKDLTFLIEKMIGKRIKTVLIERQS